MPNFPYILEGTVFDTDGTTALSGVKVTVRNERSNVTLTYTTNSTGGYIFDLANFSGGYANLDVITVFVIYSNLEDYVEHVIHESDGGATVNLTLSEVPASDTLRYFTVQEFFDFHHFTPGGENVPLTNEVVKVGTMVETEIDQTCSTRFSDGTIEIEVSDCDSTTGWSGSTDVTAIAVSTDNADYRTKTGALDLGKSGVTQAFFWYENGGLTSRDFSNKYLVCWVYLSSLSALRAVDNGSAITILYGSNSSNYYTKTWYYDEITTGWNLLFFKSDDREVTETGSVNDGAMTYFRIRFDNTAASDTITTGNFIIDNIFLVHEEHFQDEWLDCRSNWQIDYFLTNLPIDRLIRLRINRAEEGFTPVYDEILESNNEFKIDYETGLIRLLDTTDAVADATRNFPAEGKKQVNATYIFGKTSVPKDIKKLAILMTAKDIGMSGITKAFINGRDTFRNENFTLLDSQIDRILTRYRRWEMYNT